MTTAIVAAVSRAEGVDERDLTPPLYDVVDTDALEQYVQYADEATTVVFSYRDWEVEVRGGDGVEVTVSPDDD